VKIQIVIVVYASVTRVIIVIPQHTYGDFVNDTDIARQILEYEYLSISKYATINIR
jgi:hypothetical protein